MFTEKLSSITKNIMKDSGEQQIRRTFTMIVFMLLISILLYITFKTVNAAEHCGSVMSTKRKSLYLAYIITYSTQRYNHTLNQLTIGLPKFFHIVRKQSVSHNDSRIPRHSDIAVSALLLTHIDIWNEIGSKANNELGENDWAFVFEDDVGVVHPKLIKSFYTLFNVTWRYRYASSALKKTIEEGLKMARKDGIIYFGTCGPTYVDNVTTIQYSRDRLVQFRRGTYFCTHAIAYTKWRARRFWDDLAVYRLLHGAAGADIIARAWQSISKTYPLSVGSNIHWPPSTGHYGFFYQDRGNVPSIIQG